MAKHFGLRKLAVPSAGNAAGGLQRTLAAADIEPTFLCQKTCPFRELCGGSFVWRECDAGGRIDFGLRENGGGAKGERGLVRYFDVERSLSG